MCPCVIPDPIAMQGKQVKNLVPRPSKAALWIGILMMVIALVIVSYSRVQCVKRLYIPLSPVAYGLATVRYYFSVSEERGSVRACDQSVTEINAQFIV